MLLFEPSIEKATGKQVSVLAVVREGDKIGGFPPGINVTLNDNGTVFVQTTGPWIQVYGDEVILKNTDESIVVRKTADVRPEEFEKVPTPVKPEPPIEAITPVNGDVV